MEHSFIRKKNRNTPCRRRRNALRAEAYRQRNISYDVATQTELTAPPETTLGDGRSGGKDVHFKKIIPVDSIALSWDQTSSSSEEEEVRVAGEVAKKKSSVLGKLGFLGLFKGKKKVKKLRTPTLESLVEAAPLIENAEDSNMHDQEQKSSLSQDPIREMYDNIENTMRLSRLEEKANLTTALRHIVRSIHPKGKSITFSSPEAVDRLELKSVNLPTNSDELWELINKAFHRRGENIDLERVYGDFVMSHGRITLDPKKEWPHSHIHTYHP